MLAVYLLLGVDSFVASLVLGALPQRVRCVTLVILFGVFDTIATVLGSSLGHHSALAIGTVGPAAVFAYACYCGASVVWARTSLSRGIVYVLPALLSLDNLLYGAGRPFGTATLASAISFGIVSSVVALLGLSLGTFARRRAPTPRVLAAVCLIVLVATSLLV